METLQTNLKTTLEDFGTSLRQLREDNRNDKELSQNHFGEPNYKVWLNHPDNVRQGEPVWVIEYAGILNGYTWKTISEGNY